MKFEWDATKANANLRKHGVSFDEACSVFYDPFQLTGKDETHSDVEERWITIGASNRPRVLVVVTTERENDVLRIISARKANRAEVYRYEQAQRRASRGDQ